MKIPYLTLTVFLLSSSLADGRDFDPSILMDGDIIFHESRSDQAKAIKLATGSRYTHVGIIFRDGGKLRVLEAVQPVSVTSLERFVRRSVGGHFVVKRLAERERHLTPAVIAEMKRLGRGYLGKNYDYHFGWDDSRIYCTELVWKLYKRTTGLEVGRLQRLGEFSLSHPFVQNIMRRRYGNRVPLNEPVISPSSMFDSGLLVTVANVK